MSTPILVIEGGRRLRKQLKAGEVDLADLREVNMHAADIVTGVAKPTTPRRTGRLAATVRPGATRTQAVIRAGKASVPYAGPIHWGWPARGITAQPWLTEAARRTEPTWIPVYEYELNRIVEACAGGPR